MQQVRLGVEALEKALEKPVKMFLLLRLLGGVLMNVCSNG